MKTLRALLILGFLFLIFSCASFPSKIGSFKSFAYGGMIFDDKRIDVTSITARSVDQKFGFASRLTIIGKNEYFAENWKPGQYYIETITFQVPHGILGLKKEEKMYVSLDSKLLFDVKENSITSIGSYHCEIIIKFGKADNFQVLDQSDETDKLILNDLIKLAESSEWHAALVQYSNNKNWKIK